MNGQKLPVSILQEMMVKKGTAPNYELITNGSGTHQNIFTYQVSCDGFTAIGAGRCKKDAKHEAAKAMLETMAKNNPLLQLPASPCETPVRTPLPMTLPVCPKSPINLPFRNAVGELQDLCYMNNLEDPVYEEISDVGPPHARVFTMQCSVSTFVERGTATTKKQAKHQAAQKMVARITAVVGDEFTDVVKDANEKQVKMAGKIAMEKYPEVSVNNEAIKSKVNWGLKVANFYKKLKDSIPEESRQSLQAELKNLSDLVQNCKTSHTEESADLKQKLEDTLQSVDIQINCNEFVSRDSNIKFVAGIQLNTAPDIYEIGFGKTLNEAEVSALEKAINSLQYFLT